MEDKNIKGIDWEAIAYAVGLCVMWFSALALTLWAFAAGAIPVY